MKLIDDLIYLNESQYLFMDAYTNIASFSWPIDVSNGCT